MNKAGRVSRQWTGGYRLGLCFTIRLHRDGKIRDGRGRSSPKPSLSLQFLERFSLRGFPVNPPV